MSENKEIELKDIFSTVNELLKELQTNFFKIFLFVTLITLLSLVFSLSKDSRYKAELSFVVEDTQKSTPLSSMSGLASQFGFDMFSSSNSTFSQANIMDLLKSRGVISKTLLQKNNYIEKSDFFIDSYLKINSINADWNELPDLNDLNFNDKLTITHDSVITLVWQKIIKEDISVEIKNDETDIIYLSFRCSDEKFAKFFSESLISEMSRMYISYQTKQSTNTISFLQNRADSVFVELEKAEQEFARVKDINQRIIKASGRLKELQLMRNVEVLNTMYLELVKNIEVSKLTLLNQTPIIQVIDKPILPLEDTKMSTFLVLLITIFISTTFSVLYFVLKKLVKDSLSA